MTTVPDKVLVDLTGASEAVGVHTTYYAGVVKVGGKEFVVDGKTDRDDGWQREVWEALQVEFGDRFELASADPQDDPRMVEEVMDLGHAYEVTFDGSVTQVA